MIDWIVAEWIASRIAGTGDAEPVRVDLTKLAKLSEERVVAYTGLTPTEPLPPPEGVSRPEWIAANISSMRRLMDPVMERAGKDLGALNSALALTLGVTASTEVGVLMGYMAQRVLGQYELVMLADEKDPRPPRLLFVMPNLAKAIDNFDADAEQFMTWVALHETTHAVQFGGVPWLQPYLSGLVQELISKAEVRLDPSKGSRFSREAISRAFAALRRGDLIGMVTSEAEREVLDRVQAVMAVVEGHAEHVMDAVAPDLIPSLGSLRRALDDRRRNQGRIGRIVARLLGLELKLRQYERGKIFCDAIARAGALDRVFDSPDALPTLEEIEAPQLWLARTAPASDAAA
jgi:coenzyme F420 biosynthesis associated uncharacterized protein